MLTQISAALWATWLQRVNLFPADILKLREQYLSASGQEKKVLEKRYGRRTIQHLIEDSFTQDWLTEFTKNCPHCNTSIQVRGLTHWGHLFSHHETYQSLNSYCGTVKYTTYNRGISIESSLNSSSVQEKPLPQKKLKNLGVSVFFSTTGLVQIMAFCMLGAKPLPEPKMV